MKNENVIGVLLSEMQRQFDMTRLSWPVSKEKLEAIPFLFEPRMQAEKDYTLKQIIPYAIIFNENGDILTYRRAGSEQRLTGVLSAGVGGHVNESDAGNNLYEILLAGLQREIAEEIGIHVTKDDMVLAGMINEEDSEVGHCHTGVVFKVKLNASALSFDSEISSPAWMKPWRVNLNEFELWSSLALGLVCKPRRSVHITLVGGQPAPVYHGIVATEPDKVVYVYSRLSQNAMRLLRQELDIDTECVNLDTVNPTEILATAQTLAKKYEQDRVTVNISSGLKSWSHFFGVVFDRQENASVVYMDQNNVLWNYRTMSSTSGFNFDMHALFRLYGNPLDNNYRKFSDYDATDYACMLKIKEIRKKFHKEFTELTALLTSAQQQQISRNKRGIFAAQGGASYVEWHNSTPSSTGFAHIHLEKKNGKTADYELQSEHVTHLLFNTGWFEYEVATLLDKWSKTTEILLDCRFAAKHNLDKNQVDVIVNTGTKILFVECKTQIAKITDIDKFRSVVKNYGGLGSKGLIITDSRMSDVARQKCKDNGLLHFSLSDYSGSDVQSALTELLDKELYNFNTK